LEETDRFIAIPKTLDLQAVLVQAPAAITVAQIIRIVILEGFITHAQCSSLAISWGKLSTNPKMIARFWEFGVPRREA
jgi:hypothetical protein